MCRNIKTLFNFEPPVIAFAILAPGYGPDNYTPFAETLGRG
jgi:hypothetical protein